MHLLGKNFGRLLSCRLAPRCCMRYVFMPAIAATLGLTLLLLFIRSYSDQNAVVVKSQATSLIETAREVNFGDLELGQNAAFTFRVLNNSSNAFKVVSQESNCGCAEFDLTTGETVSPGEFLNVPTRVPSVAVGKRRSELVIRTDALETELAEIRLTVEASFAAPAVVSPQKVVFDSGDSRKHHRIKIVSISKKSDFLSKFASVKYPEFLTVNLVDQKSGSLEFDVLLRAEKLESDWAKGSVTFLFDDPRQSSVSVAVYCESGEDVSWKRGLYGQ